MIRFAFLTALLVAASVAHASSDMQIGLANERVAITSNFDGDDVVVFGNIESDSVLDLRNGRYDVVVVLVGPDEDVTVRRKEKSAGIWHNGEARTFTRVPSFYSMAMNRNLNELATQDLLDQLQIGFSNLRFDVASLEEPTESDEEFRASLSRLWASKRLSITRATGVKFISPGLFRASLSVPANVPVGRHTVRAYLFKGREFITKKSARLVVRKTGFEQSAYNMAHRQSLLYGILCVLIAIATGWLASVVFRKD